MVQTLSAGSTKTVPLSRVLGFVGALGSPLIVGMAIPFEAIQKWGAWIGLAFLVSWICTLIGIRLLRATGAGRAAKVLFVVQMTALCLACGQQVQDGLLKNPSANGLVYAVCDIAWPTSMLLLLVLFTFIVKAGVWQGWRRWPALLPSGSLLVFFALAAVLGREKAMIPVLMLPVPLGFFLLGLAVATGKPQAATTA